MSANELHITEGDLPVTHDSAVEAEHLTSMDPQPPHQVDTGGGIEIENTIESTDIDGHLIYFIILLMIYYSNQV